MNVYEVQVITQGGLVRVNVVSWSPSDAKKIVENQYRGVGHINQVICRASTHEERKKYGVK